MGRDLLMGVCRVMCGRKARDALLQALLVPASSVIDKTNLPPAKAGSYGTSVKTCLRKGAGALPRASARARSLPFLPGLRLRGAWKPGAALCREPREAAPGVSRPPRGSPGPAPPAAAPSRPGRGPPAAAPARREKTLGRASLFNDRVSPPTATLQRFSFS
ncbi:unnamed protein product, partial [Bubo scandiacus]